MKKRSEEISLGKFMLRLVGVAVIFLISLVMFTRHKKDAVDPEMNEFFNSNISPILYQMQDSVSKFPELNQRHQYLLTQITKRYGKYPSFIAVTKIYENNHDGVAFSRVSVDTQEITIVIPILKRIYDSMQGNDRQRQFEVLVSICLLHEMDHLAGGWGMTVTTKYTAEEEVEFEANAWAQTCEYSIYPLVERGVTLDPLCQRYYDGWVSCKHRNDTNWKKFLEQFYLSQYQKDLQRE